MRCVKTGIKFSRLRPFDTYNIYFADMFYIFSKNLFVLCGISQESISSDYTADIIIDKCENDELYNIVNIDPKFALSFKRMNSLELKGDESILIIDSRF